MMPADIPAFTQNPLLPGSLDQAWMELLSLPELQVWTLNLTLHDKINFENIVKVNSISI